MAADVFVAVGDTEIVHQYVAKSGGFVVLVVDIPDERLVVQFLHKGGYRPLRRPSEQLEDPLAASLADSRVGKQRELRRPPVAGCLLLRTQYSGTLAHADARQLVYDTAYHPHNAYIAPRREQDRAEIGVARHQPAVAVLVLVIDLDRIAPVDRGDDKVAVVGALGVAHKQFVALPEVEIAHRLPAHRHHEGYIVGKSLGDGDGLACVIARVYGYAGTHSVGEIEYVHPFDQFSAARREQGTGIDMYSVLQHGRFVWCLQHGTAKVLLFSQIHKCVAA